MSETVDTRVVEAKFDSKQFEQGVDKTVKKLDELKKSLTDATTGKTVAEIGNKVQDATDKASSSLEKLQNRFTSFTGMLKQKLLSGIADEIVGVFFKIKNSFESMVTSLSSAQVSVGMQRYTDILTSVRTLVSAGTSQDKAYEAIERLGTYADQTSYSLDSMVSTMSKFKTAGADIDTAARMIEGLSNAAASMGVNAQQAERAYLNLQQAYSKKVMLQNDWISFESLPMVGTQFNQAIIDAAVKVGTLKASNKVDQKVKAELDKQLKEQKITQEEYNEKLESAKTYQTVKKSGTQVKSASGITAENIGSKLASRWFTDEVMEEVFGNTYYFEQIGIEEVNDLKEQERKLKEQVKQGKLTQKQADQAFQDYLDEISAEKREQKKKELDDLVKVNKMTKEAADQALEEFDKHNHLTKFAYDAFRAGQEARSFVDVINTLKDAISRGWAKSFELIFGKLDEAADFFTKLTESQFAEAIYRIGEFRNLVLENWVRVGGRNDMIGTLQTIDDLFGSIFVKIGLIEDENAKGVFDQAEYDRLLAEDPTGYAANQYKEWAEKQDPFTKAAKELGERIAMITRNIGYYVQQIQAWFTEIDPRTGKSRLDRISAVFNDIKSIIHGAATDAAMVIGKIFEIIGKFEPVLTELSNTIDKVLGPIKELFNPKEKGTSGETVYNGIRNSLENIGKIVTVLVGENGDGPLVKIVSVLGDVLAFFVDMSIGTFSTNVQFFSDAFGLLLELLGFKSAQAEHGKSVAKGIADDIVSLGDACKDAFQAVSDFFSSVIADIRTWLGLSDQTTEGGNIFTNIANWWNTNESLQTIKKSIDDFVAKVGDWITHIPENISKFAIDIGDFFKSLFYKKKTITISPNVTITEWIKTDLLLWIEKAIEDVKTWLSDLPNNITKFGINVGDFFKSIFYTKKTITISPFTTITEWTKKDFTKDLENTLIDIGDWIKDIPNKIKNLPSLISELFNGLLYKKEKKTVVIGPNGNKQTIDVTVETELKKWLDKAILDVKTFIKDIPNKLKKIPSLISEFFKGIFYKKEKKTLVLGPNGNKTEIEVMVKTPLKEFLDTLVKAVADFVKELPTHIHNAFVGIGDFFAMLWNELLGNNTEEATDNATQKIGDTVQKGIDNSVAKVTTNTFWDKIKAIGSDIWNGVLTIFTGNSDRTFNENWIAEKVKSGIETIGSWADIAWKESSKFIEELPNTIAGIFTKDDGGSKEEGGIKGTIERFGKKIGEWISGVPNTILTFWRNAEAQIGKLWDSILGWITGKNAIEEELKNPDDQAAYEYLSKNGNPAYRAIAESFKKDALHNQWRSDNPILANLEDFFGNLKDYIVDKITHFPETVASGLASGADLLNHLLEGVTGWFSTENEKGSLEKQAEELLAEDFEKPAEGNAFLDAISKFGATISLMITKTIPGFISEGFEWVSNHAESWWNSLTNLFNGEGIDGKVDESGLSLGEKIRKGIENGLKLVSDLFTKPLFDQKEYEHLLEIDPTGYGATMYSQYATHSPILEFFRNIIVGIGDLFATAGPVILDGINTALNWVGEKIGKLTGLFNEAHGKGMKVTDLIAEKLKGPENEETPFYKRIKELGETIKNIIVKVIPNFISEAITEISMQIPDLLSGLIPGGNNNEVEKEIEKQVTESAEAAKNQWDYLYDENGLLDFSKYSSDYLGMIYDPNKKSGMFGALADEAESVEKTSEELVNRLDLIKKLEEQAEEMTGVYGELGFKGVDYDKYGKDRKEYNESVKKYNEIQDLIEKLKESDEEYVDLAKYSTDNTKEKNALTDNAIGFVKNLGDLTGAIASTLGSDTGRTIIMIVAITYLLEKLKDMFSLTDEIQAIGSAIKSTVISVVFAGITALLGYIIYLASMAPNSEAFKNVEKVFNWIITIGKIVAVIIGIWKGSNLVSDIVGLFSKDNKDVNILSKVTQNENGESPIASVMTWLTSLQNTLLKPLQISSVGEAITGVLSKVGSTISDIGATLGQTIDLLMEYVTPAIDKISAAGPKLQQSIDDMPLLRSFFEQFLGMFVYEEWRMVSSKIMTSDLSKEAVTDAEKESGTIISYLDENMDLIYAMTIILNEVSNVLKGFEDINTAKDKLKGIVELIKSDEFTELFTTLFNKITGIFMPIVSDPQLSESLMPKISNGFSTIIRYIADSLSIFGTSINGISSESIGALNSVFALIGQIVEDIDEYIHPSSGKLWADLLLGDTSLAAFGSQLNLFAGEMVGTFRSIDSIRKVIDYNANGMITTEDEFQSFINAIAIIKQFGTDMLGLQVSEHMISKDQAQILSETLPVIGGAIMNSIKTMNEIAGVDSNIDYNSIFLAIDAVSRIANTLSSQYGTGYFSNASEKMGSICDALFGKDENDKSGFIYRLAEAGQEWSKAGFSDFGGVETFIDMLYKLSHAIEVFYTPDENNEFKWVTGLGNLFSMEWATWLADPTLTAPTITPVLVIDDAFEKEASRLRNLIGLTNEKIDVNGNMSYSFDPGINLDDFKSIDYSQKFEEIKSSISDLGSSISQMQFAFIVNNADLAAAIGEPMDEWLNSNSVYLVRGNLT